MADSKRGKKPDSNKKRPQQQQQGLPQVKSDTKTIAIAPSDYEHIYSVGKAAPQTPRKVDLRGSPVVKVVKSDTPTVAIAPSDYQHIYAADKDKDRPPETFKESIPKKVDLRGTPTVKVVKSDTPTIAIAPSDYQHIYNAAKETSVPKRVVDLRGQALPVKQVKSDTPTVAIAPSDYQHIYAGEKDKDNVLHTEKEKLPAKPRFDTRGQPLPQKMAPPPPPSPSPPSAKVKVHKSDTPTIAIAPPDYEHIYHADPDKIAPAKPKVDTRGTPLRVSSQTPTEQIAPPDYVHIYEHKEDKTHPPPPPLPPPRRHSIQEPQPEPDPSRRPSLPRSPSAHRSASERRRSFTHKQPSADGQLISPDEYPRYFGEEKAPSGPPQPSPPLPVHMAPPPQTSYRVPDYDDMSRRAQPMKARPGAGEEGISREVIDYVRNFIQSQEPRYVVRRERRRSGLGRE